MKKLVQLFITALCFMFFGVSTGLASQLNFSVIPVLPENQQDKDKSYFDLKVEQNQEQEVTVLLKNGTDKEVVIETSINRATTNLNGVVEYGKMKDNKDSSLLYNIEDLVKITEPEVKIPAQEEKELKLKIKGAPSEFEGILTGGLTFKEKNVEEKKDDKGKGLAITNEYAYVVGFVLHGSNGKLDSEIKLTNVEAAQVNARNVINATLQNPKAKYLNEMSVDAEVTKKGSKEILYSSKKKNMQMAPNSNFAYPINLEGKPLKPGKYTVTMKIKSSKNKWEVKKDFSIDKKKAESFNEKDVSIKKDSSWIFILAGSVLILGLIILIVAIVLNKKKKERLRELKRKKIKANLQKKKKKLTNNTEKKSIENSRTD